MELTHEQARGSRFEDVDLSGSELRAVDLSGSRFLAVDLSRTVMHGVDLVDVEIHGQVERLVINGVDVAPLVEAELDRRHPDRPLMRPTDADGFRRGWARLEELWAGTVDRARRLESEQLHASVDGEWSFVETLRHLVFATDSWLRRGLLGEHAPWHPLSLPCDELAHLDGVPCDRAVRPDLDTVLAVRADRQSGVRAYLADLDDAALTARTEPVEGPGWPPPESFDVREVLLTVLNEEWEHRLYAERDLAALESRAP